jgi:hypothetical protein
MTASISTAARGLAIALVAGAAFLAVRPGAAARSDSTATPASLASVFAAARPGDTILLASGYYGVFKGAMKSGEVTLRPQPGAAATLSLSFSPAANITVDGVTLSEIDIGDRRTRNITVRNSDVPGQTTMHTDELQHANVLFDHNVHRDWDKTDACRCGEGRISLQGESDQPTGITIRDSEFRGGMSDGIQNGSTGTRILDNTFHDLVAGTPDGVHTDAIQLYGSKATVIRGNYFHDIGAAQIMAPDGADHEVIEDNVFGPGDYPFAVTIWSDDGSTIRHNTMAPGSCWFHLPCGIVTLGQKDSCRYAVECDPGRGTVIEDNILADVAIGEGKADFTSRSNLFSGDGARGAGALGGRPLFVAGAHPTTYEGFRLAPPSPGRANASDGRDRGIRGRADIGSPPAATASSVRVLSSLRSIGRTGRLRLRIRTATAGVVVLSGTVRPGRAVAAATGRHSRGAIVLRPVSLGTRAAGAKLTATVKLGLRDRATLGRSRGARLSVRLAVGSEVTAASLTIKR